MAFPADPARAAPTPGLPAGLRVAGTGLRVGAWMLDMLFLFVANSLIGFALLAAGVVADNPQAITQLSSGGRLPDVPLYSVDLFALGLVEAAFAVAAVSYATWCWHRFRATPGQKLLSLQVGDAATGRNLSIRQSLTRAILLYGVLSVAATVLDLAFFYILAVAAPSEILGAGSPWHQAWVGVSILAVAVTLFSIAWLSILLVSVLGDRHRQGVHDRAAGSLVAARVRAVGPELAVSQGASYGPLPGYTPTSTGWSGSNAHGLAWLGFQPPQSSDQAWLSSSAPSPSDEPAPPADGDRGRPGGISEPDRPDTPRAPFPPDRDPDEVPRWQRPALWSHDDDYDKAPRRSSMSGMGRRSGAYVLDCVLVFMMFYLVLEVVGIAAQGVFSEKTSIIAGLIGGAEQAFYFIGGWLVSRGTLGQRILHLEVHDATTAKRLSFQDAFIRWTVLQGPFAAATIAPFGVNQVISALAIAWAFYLFYSTMTAKDGRGLHDRIANSAVSPDL